MYVYVLYVWIVTTHVSVKWFGVRRHIKKQKNVKENLIFMNHRLVWNYLREAWILALPSIITSILVLWTSTIKKEVVARYLSIRSLCFFHSPMSTKIVVLTLFGSHIYLNRFNLNNSTFVVHFYQVQFIRRSMKI